MVGKEEENNGGRREMGQSGKGIVPHPKQKSVCSTVSVCLFVTHYCLHCSMSASLSLCVSLSVCLSVKAFEDLDEIIARYIQPMAAYARDLSVCLSLYVSLSLSVCLYVYLYVCEGI